MTWHNPLQPQHPQPPTQTVNTTTTAPWGADRQHATMIRLATTATRGHHVHLTQALGTRLFGCIVTAPWPNCDSCAASNRAQHTRRLLPNQIRVHVLLSRTCNGNRLTTLPDTTSSNAVNRNKPPCPSSTASKRCIGQPIEWKELLKENAAHACIGCYVKGMDLVAIVRTDSSSASFLAAACNRKQTM